MPVVSRSPTSDLLVQLRYFYFDVCHLVYAYFFVSLFFLHSFVIYDVCKERIL